MTGTETQDAVDTFAEHLFGLVSGALDALSIDLGRRLGLYEALADVGPATAGELAAAARIDARYAREWLEQQAAAGFLTVDDARAEPDARLFALTAGARACLVDPDDPASMGPFVDSIAALAAVLDPLTSAYRTGGGVPWGAYPDVSRIQGDTNRPALRSQLTQGWLPAVPGLVERLSAPGARVAELGCGEGWAGIAIAQAFPQVTVDAFDLFEPSLDAGRAHAAAAGVADRVRFTAADISRDLAPSGDYDLVLTFETLHDLPRPVEALAAARGLVRPGGTVLVADERVGDAFTAPAADSLDALFYAFSVLMCLPNALVESPSAATGTVIRPDTVRRYATEAGFAGVDLLPIDAGFQQFYLLHP
jgi:2-polyprenyl-3-methyl-5-hydroxy-6-metoxy-1,4-benzoquinol methylase